MQAVLRFNGSEEIVISNQVGGVMVEFYEGFGQQDCGCRSGTREDCVTPDQPCPREGRRQRLLQCFTKSQARSIASAIMGAAAEL